MNTVEKLTQLAKTVNGFTATPSGDIVDINEGYAVAIKGFDKPSDLIIDAAENNNFVGFWHDETGKEYWDEVIITEDQQTAMQIARKQNELAIWDFKNKSEIRTR
jgi:hypothetical protein